jgi:hypothetical protein
MDFCELVAFPQQLNGSSMIGPKIGVEVAEKLPVSGMQ